MIRKVLALIAVVSIIIVATVIFMPVPPVPIDPSAGEDPWVLFYDFSDGEGYTVDEPIPTLGLIKIVVPEGSGGITLKFILANAGLGNAVDVRFVADSADIEYCLKPYQYRLLFECEPSSAPVFTLLSGSRLAVTMTVQFTLWPVLIDLVEDENGVSRVGPDRILVASGLDL